MESKIAIMGSGFGMAHLHQIAREQEMEVVNLEKGEKLSDIAERQSGIVIRESPSILTTLNQVFTEAVERDKRKAIKNSKKRQHKCPPRSMTAEELAYYQQHKTLSGFANTTPNQ